MTETLARLRVPLGFVSGAVALVLARPTPRSVTAGLLVAVTGEAVRVWAAGHIEKGREVTRSGPYRFVRHPLYLGSALMGAGFMWAAQSVWAAILVALYLSTTLTAAMRAEDAALAARFGPEYAAYREGRAAPVARAFSWARAMANREHRAMLGLAIGAVLLYLRAKA